jgi:hypothetical protein
MGENVMQVLSHDSCVCNSFLCDGFSSATGSICGMEGNCSGISQPPANGCPLQKRFKLPSSAKSVPHHPVFGTWVGGKKTEVREERVLYWQHGGALSVSGAAVTNPCVA